jgi:hypothetical protein
VRREVCLGEERRRPVHRQSDSASIRNRTCLRDRESCSDYPPRARLLSALLPTVQILTHALPSCTSHPDDAVLTPTSGTPGTDPLPDFSALQIQSGLDMSQETHAQTRRANVQTLQQMFPALDEEIVEAVLEGSGDDLGLAIDRLVWVGGIELTIGCWRCRRGDDEWMPGQVTAELGNGEFYKRDIGRKVYNRRAGSNAPSAVCLSPV